MLKTLILSGEQLHIGEKDYFCTLEKYCTDIFTLIDIKS